jgi:lipopolysaccharide export system protein LptA
MYMPLTPKVLRKLFASVAIITVLVVAGVYFYRIYLVKKELREAPKKIPGNVAQSIKGFTFSKSQGGHTLFTIHAAQAEQFKEGQRAELHDVNIVIYGRQSERFDQIYGSDFEYDPQSGEITAKGDVNIDLEANSSGSKQPDQAPPQEMKNPIHLKTSGLTFNRNTGFAQTQERIEFHMPEASGSAVGATYDSHSNLLTLQSAVRLTTMQKQKVTITAQSAVISKDPRKAVLQAAHLEQPSRTVQADRLTILVREDNMIDRVQAAGNVHAHHSGPKAFDVSAPVADFIMGQKNQVRSGTLSGGVAFSEAGTSPMRGKSGRLLLEFGPANQLVKARAEESVQLAQGPSEKLMQLQSEAVDVFIENGKKVSKAVTSGPAQVLLTQGQTKTVITAGEFQAKFNPQNRPSSIFGSSNTKVVSSTPGQTDRITTSHDLTANLNAQGTLTLVEQNGDFHFQEGTRTATAEQARYLVADDNFTLTGSPRLADTGVVLTANTVQINRKTNNAVAQGDVKTTYADLKPQPGGALLAAADPIHVTGTSMTANRGAEVARFTKARLWQGVNIVEAPVMIFDRAHRSLEAQGSPESQVTSVFVQPVKNGKSTPVNVTADKLTYVDSDRKAVFSGHVVVRGAEATIAGETAQVFLLPRGSQATGSQLDRITAEGDLLIQQQGRKATGNLLVYTAQDQKCVLTATDGRKPSIFDAEQGQITGDSLTFFFHDDRVLVGSKESSHTLIQTRIRDASKK